MTHERCNLEEINWIDDKGYLRGYVPDHPNSDKSGQIYQHVYVMSFELGRPLTKDEVVHHIDRNKKNNAVNNLHVMSRRDHTLLHLWEDYGIRREDKACKYCDGIFTPTDAKQIFCSLTCSALYQGLKTKRPSKEDLYRMVWAMPSTKIALYLGVSDRIIGKWCKRYGIDKPPRGYWTKIKSPV